MDCIVTSTVSKISANILAETSCAACVFPGAPLSLSKALRYISQNVSITAIF